MHDVKYGQRVLLADHVIMYDLDVHPSFLLSPVQGRAPEAYLKSHLTPSYDLL